MIYEVSHETRIGYEEQVRLARFNLRLRPVDWPGQQVSDFKLTLDPGAANITSRSGPYPVNVTRVVIDEPLSDLVMRSEFTVHVEDALLDMGTQALSIEQVSRAALAEQSLGATSPVNYFYPSPRLPLAPEIAAWSSGYLDPGAPAVDSALALARKIQSDFVYDSDATEANTPVDQAFQIRRGVCQDFTHILIVALRAAGLPAGYASGYLRTTPPPGEARLVGADAMHAWALLWGGPQRGWVGIDPTNGCLAGPGHIFVAMGRDYSDVAPIDGIFVGGGHQDLHTAVDVLPIEG
jgi:transglutaminase-like putative cysteine protease